MALLFMDGFEGYIDRGDLLKTQGDCFWSTYSSPSAAPLVFNSTIYRTAQTTPANSRSLEFGAASGDSPDACLTTPRKTELIVGFAYRLDWVPGSIPASIIRFGDDICQTEGYGLAVNSSRQLIVGRLSGSQVYYIDGTASTPVTLDAWHYIEIRVLYGNGTGECEVYLDGVQVLNLTGRNTSQNVASSGYQRIYFGRYSTTSSHPRMYIDDLYVCDTTGADNNSFLGPVGVFSLMPTGAGSSTQMTAVGAASNWEAVDEGVSDDATTYVESSTNGHIDYYAFEALPPAAGINTVPGVMMKVKATTDSANRGLFLKLKNGANIITSAVKNFFAGGWAYNYHIAEKAPDGTDWTPTSVDNTEAGQEIN